MFGCFALACFSDVVGSAGDGELNGGFLSNTVWLSGFSGCLRVREMFVGECAWNVAFGCTFKLLIFNLVPFIFLSR